MIKKLLVALGGLVAALAVFALFITLRFEHLCSVDYAALIPSFTIHDEVVKGDVELGKRIYLVRATCVECHGPDLAGRRVIESGALGSIFGTNITPFTMKGITDEQIAAAIRYGVHHTGRSLRFMPSFDFEKLSKADLGSLIAYIRSVPPVERLTPQDTYGPVARLMSALGKMPVMFPARFVTFSGGFGSKPPEGPTAEFGRYLAQACTGCHGAEFRGGPIPGGDPSWPAASDIRFGAAPSVWTEEVFRQMIESGISPRSKAALRPPMVAATDLLRQYNETERKAIWEFLSSLK